jgi:hypothetical protein
VNTIKDYSAFKNMAGNAFEGGGAKDIMKTTTLSDLFSAGKVDEGFEMMTDAFSKNADTLIQAQTSASKAGIKTVINTADDFISNPALLREGAEELSGLIKNKYFASTVMEKVTGSSFMKFATMVGGEEALFKIAGKVPVSLASIATVGATTASILSLTHQESMIQSATNLSTFQKVKGEDSLNGKSSQALYANNGRSMSNDQDLDYVLRSSNNAEQYRRDAAPLEIDKTKSNIGNFTLY